jgi:hypothetical protein
MVTVELYPMALRCTGDRGRPRRLGLLADGCWRVEWIDGLVTLYERDPREHLRLGYEPTYLRRAA